MDTLAIAADRLELQDLIARLGTALDDHRFDDLRELMADSITVQTPGGTARGRDAAVVQATRNHERYDWLQHQFSGVLVDLDGDRAAVRANMLGVFGNAPDKQPSRVLGAVYRCEAVRTPDGWRFASVEVGVVWFYGEAPVPVPA